MHVPRALFALLHESHNVCISDFPLHKRMYVIRHDYIREQLMSRSLSSRRDSSNNRLRHGPNQEWFVLSSVEHDVIGVVPAVTEAAQPWLVRPSFDPRDTIFTHSSIVLNTEIRRS